jgi:MFS family permease
MVVGSVEACAFVLIEPTLFAVISDSSPESQRGAAMGIGGLFQFGGSALGAAVLGALYGVGEGIAFWGAAGTLLAAAVLCGLALPSRRATVESAELPAVTAMMPLDS